EVGALVHTGGLDLVGHLEHGRVDRVDRDPADLVARVLVEPGGNVAATTLDDQLDLQAPLLVEGGDVQVRVVHLDAGGRDDVTGGDGSRTLLLEVHGDRLVLHGRDDQALEVEDDVGDILLHARHGGELVQDALDADAGDRCARD